MHKKDKLDRMKNKQIGTWNCKIKTYTYVSIGARHWKIIGYTPRHLEELHNIILKSITEEMKNCRMSSKILYRTN